MNRIKELRLSENESQDTIASIAEVTSMTISRWEKEKGASQIKNKKAQKLADHFGVPVAYLLGFQENDSDLNRLKELREKNNLSLEDIKKFLKQERNYEVSSEHLTHYENGDRPPKDKNFWIYLSEFFDVPVDFILGKRDEPIFHLDEFIDNINPVGVESSEDGSISLSKDDIIRADIFKRLKSLGTDDLHIINEIAERFQKSR